MKDPQQLTPAEFEIIQILWQEEESLSVGQVLEVMRKRKQVAYTTIMTLLDKMARKGSLSRKKRGKAYFYSPRVKRSEVLSYLVREFADHYFGGQADDLGIFLANGSRKGGRSQSYLRRLLGSAKDESAPPAPPAAKSPPSRPRSGSRPRSEKEMDDFLL